MDPLQTYVHLKGLMDSVNMTIGDRKDVLLFFATAILYRHGLTSQQRAVMDSREIVTFKELNRLAISLQTTDSNTRDRVRDGRRINYHGSIKCFNRLLAKYAILRTSVFSPRKAKYAILRTRKGVITICLQLHT